MFVVVLFVPSNTFAFQLYVASAGAQLNNPVVLLPIYVVALDVSAKK